MYEIPKWNVNASRPSDFCCRYTYSYPTGWKQETVGKVDSFLLLIDTGTLGYKQSLESMSQWAFS